MDIKIGEFVRTAKGKFYKIKTINRYGIVTKYENKEDEISSDINYYTESGLEINKKDITKHSFNLIDLIEVGDIVFTEDFPGHDFIYINDKEMLEALKQDVKDGVRIKEILTKELYKSNCYTVERKNRYV